MKATLDNDFSITSVSGRGGDGKSYVIVSELAKKRMVRKNYRLVTNLPLTEDFYRFVAARKNCTPQEVKARVTILDNETLDSMARMGRHWAELKPSADLGTWLNSSSKAQPI